MRKSAALKKCVLILFSALYLILVILMFGFKEPVDFAFGYYVGDMISFILLFGCMFLVLIILAALLTLELFFTWRHNHNKAGTKKGLILRICVIGIGPLLFWAYMLPGLFNQDSVGITKFHEGFYLRVTENIDINQVREWVNNIDDETFEKWNFCFHPKPVNPVSVPEDIFKFRPNISYVTLFEDENGIRCVNLEWGGPFGRWGIIVGAKEIDIPDSDTERYGRFRYQFDDSNDIYSWQQIR